MINKMLGRLEGADVWMGLSLMIFVLFFIGVCVYLYRMSNTYTETMKQVPLQDDSDAHNSFNP
jgi:cytochrome c oxidase cbb3-type subunit 3